MAPRPQEQAPGFIAPDQNGKMHSLEDYRGRWIFLYFYPKDHTPGCTKEACSFRDAFGSLQDRVILLGVSHDSPSTHLRFASKHRLPFPLLSDPGKKIIQAYGAKGWLFTRRISFLIDPEGKIAKVYEKVSPAEHAKEVLEDLEQFQNEFHS